VSGVRDQVIARSGGRCEAMIKLPRTWTRCGRTPVEDHHVLTRARGGDLLDEQGEIYHHLALCPRHHRMVDQMGFKSGLLIQGSVYRDGARIVYVGPDPFLTAKYGPQLPVLPLQEDLPGSEHGQMARGAL
jgi:hypothetical protein